MADTSSKTHWVYSITVDGTCRVGTGKTTLPDVLADAFKSATYYLWLYPDRQVVVADIREVCSACDNTGKVMASRSRVAHRTKRCPACKGRGASGRLANIPVSLSDGNGGRGFRIVEND